MVIEMGKICGFTGLTDNHLLRKMCLSFDQSIDPELFLDRGIGLGLIKMGINDHIASSDDGSVYACLDGVIYGTPKTISSSISDAEKLVYLYDEYGVDLVHRIRGCFTLAIWDVDERKLLLIRDKIGRKPLFHTQIDGKFFFASEIKPILKYEEIRRKIDPNALSYFLAYSYIPAPFTIFKNIKKLPPSSILEYDLDDESTTISGYWEPELRADYSLHEEKLSQKIYEILQASILSRVRRCTSPLSGLLSGGIDSSLILAFLRKLTHDDDQIMAFTTGFEEPEYNESRYALKVADFLGLDHHVQVVGPHEISKYLSEMIWNFEEPFGGNAIAHFLNLMFAKEFTDEVFSGDGGDEAFYYPFYRDSMFARFYQRLPKGGRQNIITPILNRFLLVPGLRRVVEILTGSEIAEISVENLNSPQKRVAQRVAFFPFQAQIPQYCLNEETFDTASGVEEYFEKALQLGAPNFSSIVSYVIFRTRLPDCMIRVTECLSNAVRIAVRSPMLDVEVMKASFAIPSYMKIRDGKAKYILRKTARRFGLLPKEIVDRKKMGFPLPIERWLRGELNYLITDMLESEATNKYLNQHYLEKMVKTFKRSTRTGVRNRYAYYLWSLIAFQRWYEMYMENEVKRP